MEFINRLSIFWSTFSLKYRKLSSYQIVVHVLNANSVGSLPITFNSCHKTYKSFLNDVECLKNHIENKEFKLETGDDYANDKVYRDRFLQGWDYSEFVKSLKDNFNQIGLELYAARSNDTMKITILKARLKLSLESYIRAMRRQDVIQSKGSANSRRNRRV